VTRGHLVVVGTRRFTSLCVCVVVRVRVCVSDCMVVRNDAAVNNVGDSSVYCQLIFTWFFVVFVLKWPCECLSRGGRGVQSGESCRTYLLRI